MPEVYKIGVAIAVSGNAEAYLGSLAKQFAGLNNHVKSIEAGIGRVKLAVGGMAGVAVGGAMLDGLGKLIEGGKAFVHQQSLMAQAGINAADIAKLTAAAWSTTGSVIGSDAEKNIKLVHDLRDALGSVGGAIQALPSMSKLGVFLGNGMGADPEKAGYSAARFIEMRGGLVNPITHQVDESRMESQARLVASIAAGTHFRVGPDQLMMFQQYARAAGAELSDRGLINMAPVIAASSRPSTVGTQLASLQQQILGGVTTQAGASFLEQLGVLNSGKVHQGRGGHMQFDRGALVDGALAGADPVSWIGKYVQAGLIRMGDASADTQTRDLMASHLRATVVGLLTEVTRSLPAFTKDSANIIQAAGVNQYDVGQKTDPDTQINNFTTAFKNLRTALGAPLVADATGGLRLITDSVTYMTGVISKHPKLVEDLELTAGALGVLGVASGSAAIAAAAFGPMATGLRALAGAAVGFSAGGPAATALAGLTSVAGSSSLLLFASRLGVLGAAIAAAILAMKEIGDLGPPNPHPNTNAHGFGYSNRTPVSGAPPPTAAPASTGDGWSSLEEWMTRPATHSRNARGFASPAAYEGGNANYIQPINLTVHLDGQVIAKNTTMHQKHWARRPQAMGNSFDPMEFVQRPATPLTL